MVELCVGQAAPPGKLFSLPNPFFFATNKTETEKEKAEEAELRS